MALLVGMVVAGAFVFAAVGFWAATGGAHWVARQSESTQRGLVARLAAVTAELRRQLGGAGAYVALVLAGTAATVVVCWPLGRVAKRSLPLDRAVFDFFNHHQAPAMTDVMRILTQMGNRWLIKDVLVVAVVVFAVLWRRRWWVPVVVLATCYPAEKFLQSALAKVVDRGHPPTTLGTYPSGGCARLIVIYGTIWTLVLLRFRGLPRAAAIAGWVVLAVAAWLEGFSRAYLLKHWVTDVVGGWVFGVLLLAVFGIAATVLAHPSQVSRHRDAGSPRPGERVARHRPVPAR